MADTIPLIMATGDIRATDGAIMAVGVTARPACSAAVYLERAMAEGRTGDVVINLGSAKGWAAACKRPSRYMRGLNRNCAR